MNYETGDLVRVDHPGMRGVAYYVTGPEMVSDIDTVWTGEKLPTGMILAHAVGDDRIVTLDPEDCARINDAVCSCGQLGCGWAEENL